PGESEEWRFRPSGAACSCDRIAGNLREFLVLSSPTGYHDKIPKPWQRNSGGKSPGIPDWRGCGNKGRLHASRDRCTDGPASPECSELRVLRPAAQAYRVRDGSRGTCPQVRGAPS